MKKSDFPFHVTDRKNRNLKFFPLFTSSMDMRCMRWFFYPTQTFLPAPFVRHRDAWIVYIMIGLYPQSGGHPSVNLTILQWNKLINHENIRRNQWKNKKGYGCSTHRRRSLRIIQNSHPKRNCRKSGRCDYSNFRSHVFLRSIPEFRSFKSSNPGWKKSNSMA